MLSYYCINNYILATLYQQACIYEDERGVLIRQFLCEMLIQRVLFMLVTGCHVKTDVIEQHASE